MLYDATKQQRLEGIVSKKRRSTYHPGRRTVDWLKFPHRDLASYVVGELTRRGLEAGHRMCLFTDRANPTSNKIYAGLGYEPTVDMAEHVVRVAGDESSPGEEVHRLGGR